MHDIHALKNFSYSAVVLVCVIFMLVPISSKKKRRAYYLHNARPSYRMFYHGFHWKDFREIWYCRLLRKFVDKLRIWLQLDATIGHITLRPNYFCTFDRGHPVVLLQY